MHEMVLALPESSITAPVEELHTEPNFAKAPETQRSLTIEDVKGLLLGDAASVPRLSKTRPSGRNN